MWNITEKISMSLKEWKASEEWFTMLGSVRTKEGLDDRFFRLFATATCRLVWDRLDATVRDCVRYAEYLADMPVRNKSKSPGTDQHSASYHGADSDCFVTINSRLFAQFPDITTDLWAIGQSLVGSRLQCDAFLVPGCVATQAGWLTEAQLAELVREILPDPIHGPPPVPTKLVSDECYNLAVALYMGGGADSLAIIGEYLKQSGCKQKSVLAHCAEPHFHPKGCWVLEGILFGR
jgi:hypothetical protein